MKSSSVRKSLGLSQQELADLLQVSRIQITLYETGRRSLPLKALQLLGTLLTNIPESSAMRMAPESDHRIGKRREEIERLLKENEYQRLRLSKKLAATEKKVLLNESRSKLAQVLQQDAETIKLTGLNTSLLAKDSQVRMRDFDLVLVQLQLKQELLQVEEKYLASQLRKLTMSDNNSKERS